LSPGLGTEVGPSVPSRHWHGSTCGGRSRGSSPATRDPTAHGLLMLTTRPGEPAIYDRQLTLVVSFILPITFEAGDCTMDQRQGRKRHFQVEELERRIALS
ncbi:MAG TPA: hypothetical protein VKP69_30660, partial [Isosphaeraceae bacterium]|nr:hypothetical protein [Isosphaeraceae bacterium]